MTIGELARRTGVTTKAVRYYESLGLISPDRLANGYRVYDLDDVRLVEEIKSLHRLGIPSNGPGRSSNVWPPGARIPTNARLPWRAIATSSMTSPSASKNSP